MSIRVEKVNYIYGKGTPYERKALDGVNLEIHKGEFVGIIGHTGSGKSTLVQHLNGLLHPSEGRVTVERIRKLLRKDTPWEWYFSIRNSSCLRKP